MSWPEPAATSAAFFAARSLDRMWSAWTSTLFLVPQSLAHWSNQVSYAGTKCDDIRILSVPVFANPPGAACAGAGWAAVLPAAVGAGGWGAPELQAANNDPIATPPPPAASAPRKRRRLNAGTAPVDCLRTSRGAIGSHLPRCRYPTLVLARVAVKRRWPRGRVLNLRTRSKFL